MVCSIDESALRRVAEAIDQLDADRKSADSARLEARIAAVWAMVREIDPELARLTRLVVPPLRRRKPAADSVPRPTGRTSPACHTPQASGLPRRPPQTTSMTQRSR